MPSDTMTQAKAPLCKCKQKATRHTAKRHFCEKHWIGYLAARCQGRVSHSRLDVRCSLLATWLVDGGQYCSRHVERASRSMREEPRRLVNARTD